MMTTIPMIGIRSANDKIDELIIDATMEGKIESLTSDVYQGKEAQRLLERLQEAGNT